MWTLQCQHHLCVSHCSKVRVSATSHTAVCMSYKEMAHCVSSCEHVDINALNTSPIVCPFCLCIAFCNICTEIMLDRAEYILVGAVMLSPPLLISHICHHSGI